MTQMFSQGLRVSLLSLIIVALMSCENLTKPGGILFNLAKISEIQKKGKIDATVYVQGTVKNFAPFLGMAAYQLQDSSGSIWVLTTEKVPLKNQIIFIKGKVRYQSIILNGLPEDQGDFYLEEIEKLPLEEDKKEKN